MGKSDKFLIACISLIVLCTVIARFVIYIPETRTQLITHSGIEATASSVADVDKELSPSDICYTEGNELDGYNFLINADILKKYNIPYTGVAALNDTLDDVLQTSGIVNQELKIYNPSFKVNILKFYVHIGTTDSYLDVTYDEFTDKYAIFVVQ